MDHIFDNGTSDNATVAVTTTQILPKNSGRVYAVIVNDSDESIYIGLGVDAVLNKGIRLNANGGSIEIDGEQPFRGAVNGICASGGKIACFFDA